MIELGIAFVLVYAIEEMARVRRLKYKYWFSTAILGWLLFMLLRVFSPFPLAFAALGWLFLLSMYFYLYVQKVPRKKRSQSELSDFFSDIELEKSQDLHDRIS